jgi:hypothetical protein
MAKRPHKKKTDQVGEGSAELAVGQGLKPRRRDLTDGRGLVVGGLTESTDFGGTLVDLDLGTHTPTVREFVRYRASKGATLGVEILGAGAAVSPAALREQLRSLRSDIKALKAQLQSLAPKADAHGMDAPDEFLSAAIDAFARDLPELLTSQGGRFALYCEGKGGRPQLSRTFDTESEAVDAGYEHAGPDGRFAVQRIATPEPITPSSFESPREQAWRSA